MTYVEFFEKDVLENLCSCLAVAPDKVIMIGDNRKNMHRHAARYQKILQDRGQNVVFEVISVDRNRIQNLVEALKRIIEAEDECVFDLTGGEDLLLVAMGIVFEQYRERGLQMHRFNIRNNTVFDCDMDGIITVKGKTPELSVKELILANGGDVVPTLDPAGRPVEWEWTEEFCTRIDTMWEICRQNVRNWNAQTDTFGIAEAFLLGAQDRLTTTVSMPFLDEYLKKQGRTFYENKRIIKSLVSAGLITRYKRDQDVLSITYADAQIKRCLTKAGQILELAVCAGAKRALESDGTHTYHDVMTGVTIDWDGKRGDPVTQFDTENEIDVIMMHGIVPVFVSCKNGDVNSDELYKLNSVAERFGSKYVKKVLVATAVDPASPGGKYLVNRAVDMNICIVTGLQKLNAGELDRTIRDFWKRQNQI